MNKVKACGAIVVRLRTSVERVVSQASSTSSSGTTSAHDTVAAIYEHIVTALPGHIQANLEARRGEDGALKGAIRFYVAPPGERVDRKGQSLSADTLQDAFTRSKR